MKKRSIKQQVKHTEKIILEEDKDFFNDFIAENYPNEKQRKNHVTEKRRTKPILITVSSSFAVILTAVLCLIFLWPSEDSPPGKKYMLENERAVIINLNELNTSLQGISLNVDVNYEIAISSKYDSLSNDTLYYTVRLTGELETIDINIYVNKDYPNKNEVTNNAKSARINGFDLVYHEIITQDDIIFTYNCAGIIEYNKTVIYIEYEEISLENESNFFNFIEQTIKKA